MYNATMKIWINDTQTSSHRIVRLNCEQHSDFKYLGDFDNDELTNFLVELKNDIDVDKNVKLLNYYGYLHLFIVYKNSDME